MQKVSLKVPVGIKSLAEMMGMEEVEVRFFPKVEKVRTLLKDYNFGTLKKKDLIERLESLKDRCKEEGIDQYVAGIDGLIKAIQYRY
jgi:predicted transcriptional regulator